MDDFLGETIGGYELVSELGTGSIGTVYKAYQAELQRWVAIKILHARDYNTRLRFEREAKAIAKLRHRNLLTIYGFAEENNYPYMVMEYVERGTLRDQLTQEPMDWQKATKIILPIIGVLSYIHTNGIIHRNIKPSNIMMPQDNWPLLADFGMIKLSADWEANDLSSSGSPLGTPAYMSPEQVRGGTIDFRVDMYAVGVMLFEMVAGRLPFDYVNANKIMLAHTSEAVPSLREFNPESPVALERILIKALAKSPEQRYSNMDDFAKALRDVLTATFSTITGNWFGSIKQTIATTHSTQISSPKPTPEQTSKGSGKARFLLPDKTIIELPLKNTVIIGRTHRKVVADIDLAPYGAAEVGVSRRHATLARQPDGWYLDDLNSLNGTFINNIQVITGYPILLKNGDVIRCSQFSFIFYND